jgi:hypothetical protein
MYVSIYPFVSPCITITQVSREHLLTPQVILCPCLVNIYCCYVTCNTDFQHMV